MIIKCIFFSGPVQCLRRMKDILIHSCPSSFSCWSSLSLKSLLPSRTFWLLSWPWTSVSDSCYSLCSCLAACSCKSPCPCPSSPVCLSSVLLSFSPHCELVGCVEPYCCCILNSSKLMEILLLHIKLPVPCNWFFSIPNFIKPTVPPLRLFVGESVKKR